MSTPDAWAERTLQHRRRALVSLHARAEGEETALRTEKLDQHDWIDRAVTEEASTVTAGLSALQERELDLIDAALRRLADGTYGRCLHCGGAIGRQRLRVIPEASLCTACASLGDGGRDAVMP